MSACGEAASRVRGMGNEPTPEYVREHRRALEHALTLPLPDAVFAIVHYNDHNRRMGPPPHCEAIPLTTLGIKGTPAKLEEWAVKAASCRSATYDVGDALLRGDGSYDVAFARFKAAHPGFGDETYQCAVGYGCFQAR